MFYYLLGPIFTLPWHGASSAVSNLHLQEAGLGYTSPDIRLHSARHLASLLYLESFYTNGSHKCHLSLALDGCTGLPIQDLCTCGSTELCVCLLNKQEVACMDVPSYWVVILSWWQKARLDLVG